MGPGEAAIAFIIVGLPVTVGFLTYLARRFFSLREKQLEAETRLAAEKAAQYAVRTHELEDRVRILEQIVTDSGAQTAAQIEALRPQPRIRSGEQAK